MARMYDIISKKQAGKELHEDELASFVKGVADGSIPDYQISAFLMAVYFAGMTDDETVTLTHCMADSGEKLDLSAVPGRKADKHSTGGVGDKTTFIVAPMVAAANMGVCVAKIAGRGLGYTGGTVDKLESIRGINAQITRDEFVRVLSDTGLCVMGQSNELSPVDRKLYALRDVTATVNCFPLVASSVISKFITAGSDCIVLDIKCGSGAFVKTLRDATTLAELMVKTAKSFGKRASALITNMDAPLGRAVGNSLEMIEAIEVLSGRGDSRLAALCVKLAANMLFTAGAGEFAVCEEAVVRTISDGSAKQKLFDMVTAMGGDGDYIYNTGLFGESKMSALLVSASEGFVGRMDTEMVGSAAAVLGAGRSVKDAPIDHRAGIYLHKKVGDYVKEGEPLATIYTNKLERAQQGMELLFRAIKISEREPRERKMVMKTVGGYN